jgi:hypothetical protein
MNGSLHNVPYMERQEDSCSICRKRHTRKILNMKNIVYGLERATFLEDVSS